MDENQNTEDTLPLLQTIEYGSISDSLPIPSEANLKKTETNLSKVEIKLKKAKKKYTPTQWWTLVTLAFGNFCTGACIALQAPFFPSEALKKGATSMEYGFIFGIYQLTVFVTAPIMGKLVAHISPKILLNSGILTMGVTCILFGTLDMIASTRTFVALALVVRAVEGVGASALKTACYTIISSQFSDGLGTTFAILQIFVGIGCIIGPTVGGALYDLGGYGLPFYVIGSIVLIDAVVIYFMLPDVDRSPKEPQKGKFLKFWCHPNTIIYSLCVFTCYNYIGFIQVGLELYIRQFGLSGLYLGMLFALSGVIYSIFAPIWGWLSDKLDDGQTLCLVGCCINVSALLLLGPAPFLNLEPSILLIIASQILYGLGLGAKLVCAYTGTIIDTKNRGLSADVHTYGLVASMITSSQSLGAVLGPSIGGYLLDLYEFRKASMVLFILETVLIIMLIIAIVKSYLYGLTVSGSKPETSKEPVNNGYISIENFSEKELEETGLISLET